MAVVRATCDQCGDIELVPADVMVRVCLDDQRASYLFRCPTCDLPVTRVVGNHLVELLAASGSPISLWHLPAELAEVHDGDTFTHDDLLDFHQLLRDDAWLDLLIARSGPLR